MTREETEMHLCPDCESDCDCDGEDLFHETAPDDCSHECEEEDYFDGDGDDSDDLDEEDY